MYVFTFNLSLRPRIRNLDTDNPPPRRNQCYMIALTALYLYDYLLTFADEVLPTPDNQAGAHCDFTALLAGQVRLGGKENLE